MFLALFFYILYIYVKNYGFLKKFKNKKIEMIKRSFAACISADRRLIIKRIYYYVSYILVVREITKGRRIKL